MALTATEEALVRQLINQQAAILSLAGNESTITSKLGATKVTLSDLVAASTLAGADLFLTRQGVTEKSLRADILADYVKGTLNLSMQGSNILINGGFAITHRGETWPAIAHFTVTAARWRFGQSAGSAQFQLSRIQDAPTPASQFSLNAEVTTASPSPASNSEAHIRYAVEGRQAGLQIRDKVVTLSFWVKTNYPGTYSIAIVKPDSSGATEETYLASYTVNASGVWEKKSIVIDLSASVNRTWRLDQNYAIKLRFSYYAGSSFTGNQGWQSGNLIAVSGSRNLANSVGNYLRIGEVKLESGNTATPFIQKAITQELIDVQRYELIVGSSNLDSVGVTGYAGAAGETAYQTIQYPTTMRAEPIPTLATFQVANCAQPTFLPGLNSGTLKITASGVGRFAARSGNSGTPLFLDAEL